MNTMFRHKKAHKFTWNNPDGLDKSMIDYILVRQRWRTSVQDTRVYRGADIGSDHHLLVSTFRLKFKTTRAGSKPPARLDSSKLGNISTRKCYQRFLNKKLDETRDDDNKWNRIKKALSSTGNAILGRKKRIKHDWISSKTLDIVEKKRKSKLNIERVKIQKEIEKSCVNDRETWWKSKADEMETFSKRNDLRNLFSTIKSLPKKSSSASSSVVDKSGKPIHGLQKSLSRWAEYFRDLFNHGEPDNLDSDLDCLVES